MNKTALIIGNGPSTKELLELGLNNIPNEISTFASNSFYRISNKHNWWPDYYAAYDYNVTPFHKENLKHMMKNQNKIKAIYSYNNMLNGVDRFFTFNPPYGNFANKKEKYMMNTITTGGMCAFIAMMKGFKKLILIGIDCNYVNEIKETEKLTDLKFRIKENPKNNPNYFSDLYQQKGDIYTIPNKHVHHENWNEIFHISKDMNVEIINCSEKSEIKCFPFSTLKSQLNIKN